VSVQGGASIGVIAAQDGDLMVVPFFGLAAAYTRVTTEIGGIEDSASDTGGVADLGVGFILTRTVASRPWCPSRFRAAAPTPCSPSDSRSISAGRAGPWFLVLCAWSVLWSLVRRSLVHPWSVGPTKTRGGQQDRDRGPRTMSVQS
jgi:hypothetical protein